MILRNWLCCVAILSILPRVLAGADVPVTQTIFRAGDGGYASYRIPALLVTSKGGVLAFCEGRKNSASDTGEIHLLLRRSTDGGKSFGPTQTIWADGLNTCGNPCPVVDEPSGTILLLMTRNLAIDNEKGITAGTSRAGRSVWVSASSDEGATWDKPREITDQVKKPEWAWYATGPGIGIQLQHGPHGGRLIVPCDHVIRGGEEGNSHVFYSDDHGKSWAIGGEPRETKYNESQVVELSTGGRVMLNMRNIRTGKIRGQMPAGRGVAISDDGGTTFGSAHEDAALVEPICQGSIFRYSWEPAMGRILFSNPASVTSRAKMTVRASEDDGKTWPIAREIWAGPSAYSSLARMPDGQVGLLYECGEKKAYERIDLVRFAVDWLTD